MVSSRISIARRMDKSLLQRSTSPAEANNFSGRTRCYLQCLSRYSESLSIHLRRALIGSSIQSSEGDVIWWEADCSGAQTILLFFGGCFWMKKKQTVMFSALVAVRIRSR
jgi:hypothetical protein